MLVEIFLNACNFIDYIPASWVESKMDVSLSCDGNNVFLDLRDIRFY